MIRKLVFGIALGLCSQVATVAMSLDEYRWKHRLLLLPEPNPELLAKLHFHRMDITDREVVVIFMNDPKQKPLRRQLVEAFGTSVVNECSLVGKDGITRVVWKSENFRFESLFEKIDAMPMRKKEIQQRRSLLPES